MTRRSRPTSCWARISQTGTIRWSGSCSTSSVCGGQKLPLDDRFYVRALGREGLYEEHSKTTFYEGAVRIQPFEAPQTLNRSWTANAEIDVPDSGATGPIAAMAGDSSGWTIYLDDSVPTFCYNYPGPELTYIRATEPLAPGRHVVRYELEKTGTAPVGAGGIGRLFVDGEKAAEGEIARTCTVGYSMDETFDIGWDKGTAVTPEYPPNTKFTGKIVKVEFDVHPDFHADTDSHAAAKYAHAMLRQ
jgi:arylsulfatase